MSICTLSCVAVGCMQGDHGACGGCTALRMCICLQLGGLACFCCVVASMEAMRISPRLRMRHLCMPLKSRLVGRASEEEREGPTLGQTFAFLYAVVLAKPVPMEALHRKQAHGLGGESCRTPEWPRMVLRSSVVVTLGADKLRPCKRVCGLRLHWVQASRVAC